MDRQLLWNSIGDIDLSTDAPDTHIGSIDLDGSSTHATQATEVMEEEAAHTESKHEWVGSIQARSGLRYNVSYMAGSVWLSNCGWPKPPTGWCWCGKPD
jgi:hypothetical protein